MIDINRVDGLITPAQAADLCGLSPVTIRAWIRRGHLPVARRNGNRILLRVLDVAKAEHATARHGHRPFEGPPLAAEPVVYYVQFGDRIKIGTSTSLRTRLDGVPHDRLMATEPGGREVERLRHAQFAEYRLKGEWFRVAAPLLAHIGAVRRVELQHAS